MIEHLESRQLLTVIAGESITLQGTDGPDLIRVTLRGDTLRIQVNDQVERRAAIEVGQFRIRGRGGDDRIVVGNDVGRQALLHGGAGNDTILGSGGSDFLDGNSGDDLLRGRGGEDVLRGGDGNDQQFGGGRDDNLYDVAGDDLLDGGAGNDWLDDPNGTNVLRGGRGADLARCLADDDIADVESQSVLVDPNAGTADPRVTLYVYGNEDGTVEILAEATHSQGGYERNFGEMSQAGPNDFEAEITGTDLGDGSRTQVIENDYHTYSLGDLPPGTYTFTARSGDTVRAVVRFRVTESGLAPASEIAPPHRGLIVLP